MQMAAVFPMCPGRNDTYRVQTRSCVLQAHLLITNALFPLLGISQKEKKKK